MIAADGQAAPEDGDAAGNGDIQMHERGPGYEDPAIVIPGVSFLLSQEFLF